MSFNEMVEQTTNWISSTAHTAADKISQGVNWYNRKIEDLTDRIKDRYPELARIAKLFLQALPWAVAGITIDLLTGFPLTTCVALFVVASNRISGRTKTTALTVSGLALVAKTFCSHPALSPFFIAAGAFAIYTAYRHDERGSRAFFF